MGYGGNTTGIPPGGGQNANSGDPGSYGDEVTVTETLCLAVGCYDFIIYDDYGDGMEGSTSWGCNTDGYYDITNTSNTVLGSMQNVNFGNSETVNFCVVDNAGLGEFDMESFSIYPNPNDGLFTVEINTQDKEAIRIFVTDISGRTIYAADLNNQLTQIDLSKAAPGTYFVSLVDSAIVVSKPIVLK